MLAIWMSWKEKISCEQLHDDAANRPHVSYLVPFTAFQNHLRRPVLSSANDSAVRLIEQSSPSEIDDSDPVALRWPVRVSFWGFLNEFFFFKQYIFRFEVCVSVA